MHTTDKSFLLYFRRELILVAVVLGALFVALGATAGDGEAHKLINFAQMLRWIN